MQQTRRILITSTSHPMVREAVAVRMRRTKAGRTNFFLEGPHLVTAALSAGIQLRNLFISEEASGKPDARKLERAAAERDLQVHHVSVRVMHHIADTDAPQGIAAVAERPHTALGHEDLPPDACVLIADSIQDPGNLGTLIRTADAAGLDAVLLLPGTCDPFAPKALRATAGSIFHLPLIECEVSALLAWLREKKMRLAVTDAHAGDSVFSADLARPLAIALGSEAHGVGKTVRSAADMLLHIPLFGKAESLNVAAAGAIVMFEAARQAGRLLQRGN